MDFLKEWRKTQFEEYLVFGYKSKEMYTLDNNWLERDK